MFNLFKKKYKPLAQYPESWSIVEATTGTPIIVRVNMGYKEGAGHPDYPIKMGIAIPISGHHDDTVMKMKSEIEDILNEILLKKGDGSLVAIITGLSDPKFIEFLSYTKREGINFAKIHQDLKDRFINYEVQMYADNDPTWKAYKSFASI